LSLTKSSSQIDRFEFQEAVFNEYGIPRLSIARGFFSDLQQVDVPLLSDAFKLWRDYDEALILEDENLISGEKSFFGVKCSKRGNDVYGQRLDRRLGFLKSDDPVSFFNPSDFLNQKSVKTRLLWVTLTYDPYGTSLDEAWRTLGKKFNLWITNLRNFYGKISYVSFPQAFPNKEGSAFAYPHFHVILLFHDVEFNVFQRMEKDREGNFGIVYRIQEKDELHSQGKWDAFIDVKALCSLKAVYNYAKKHCFNAGYGDSDEAVINNAVMWLYRKRSFNISGDFRSKLLEFIKALRNSKKMQVDLFGNVVPDHKISLVGVYSMSEISVYCKNLKNDAWFFSLSVDQVQKLIDRRLKFR
jgi:hypothetical protein